MVGKNERASGAKFFSGTARWATEGSPQRDKAVAGRLRKAVEQKELPRWVAGEGRVGSLFAVGGGIGGQHPLFGIGDKIEQGGGEQRVIPAEGFGGES